MLRVRFIFTCLSTSVHIETAVIIIGVFSTICSTAKLIRKQFLLDICRIYSDVLTFPICKIEKIINALPV